jgi:hypothetical protein
VCPRAGTVVSQFAGECGGAYGKRVWGPQAAPNPHRNHTQPTSTPWEAAGGQPRPAECREPALWPRSGRGAAGAAGALHGPRRHLRGSGELRGRSGGVFRRPQEPHCAVTTPLLVGAPIWSTPSTGVKWYGKLGKWKATYCFNRSPKHIRCFDFGNHTGAVAVYRRHASMATAEIEGMRSSIANRK